MEVAKEALSCYRDLGLAVREGAKKLAKKIAGLRFGNEAFKEALLIDCDRFALAQTPEMQEKIFDRIVSALKSSKSPDAPPPVQSPDAINIGGHTEDAPERFRSVTL